MENKQFFVSIVNINTGKVFALPTLYADRIEACICGQNYVRDRYQEDETELFFRILIAQNGTVHAPYNIYNNEEGEEDNFDWDNSACQSSHEVEPEEPFQTKAEEEAMKMVMALTDFICEHCTVND